MLNLLNANQIGGIVRAVLATAGGWAVAQGWLSTGTEQTIATVVVAAVIAGWSAYTNKPGTTIPTSQTGELGMKK